MATIQEQISINVKWARNANHRLLVLQKDSDRLGRDWEMIHYEMSARNGFMKIAKMLKAGK